MCFLYVKEKRYAETLRLIVYSTILLFGPFVFFGGVKSFFVWFSNVQSLLSYDKSIGRIEYISGLVEFLSYHLIGSSSQFTASLISLLFVCLMLVMFFESKDRYRTVLYLCALMTFYPGNAHRYTLLYIAIPLVMYLMEKGDDENCSLFIKLEMICYGCVFSIPTIFGMITDFELKTGLGRYLTYAELWLYIFAYMILLLVVIHEFWSLYKEKKEIAAIEVQSDNL